MAALPENILNSIGVAPLAMSAQCSRTRVGVAAEVNLDASAIATRSVQLRVPRISGERQTTGAVDSRCVPLK